jgi:hypothetical protein
MFTCMCEHTAGTESDDDVAEIEITEEMIWEGVDALLHHHFGWNDREIAVAVFGRMNAASGVS